nr:ATP-binding cassette domain-containing protein [Mobiluncus mulieris]
MPTLVEIKNLSKCYTGSNSGRPPALDELNLNLEAGKIIGLLGENGSGKTTLLKILAGVLEPTAGTVTITGHPHRPEN